MARVFDCFTFFNELDLLDVRFQEMDSVVDKFVVVEATRTFQGEPKPLHFAENADRFGAFQDKIIHVVVDFPDDIELPRSRQFNSMPWGREHYQRNQIAKGLATAEPDDLVIVSDVDEILNADVLKASVRTLRPNEVAIFEMPMYSFFVDRLDINVHPKAREIRWLGPRMIRRRRLTTAQQLREVKPFHSRRMRGMRVGEMETRLKNYTATGVYCRPVLVRDAGWHFTSIGDWANWRKKIDAYCHQAEGQSNPAYRTEEAFYDWVERLTRPDPKLNLPKAMSGNSNFPRYPGPPTYK
jgi:beta-1,4-mannosyl-glycoprotein beta-1,4-N-acetylglucosaminyltransferase